MRQPRNEDGYILLMALLITAFVASAAVLGVAAVAALQSVTAADAAAGRAQSALQQALYSACDALRWHPTAGANQEDGVTETGETWHAEWRPAPSEGSSAARFTLAVGSTSGAARTSLSALVELCPERSPQGVCVAGDVDLMAATEISGSGLYAGASVRGRQWLAFPAAVSEAMDFVHPELWSAAAAHAGDGIWAHGAEIHEATATPAAQWRADTDSHTGETALATLTPPPPPAALAALHEHAVLPGDALQETTLDLGRLATREDLAVATGAAGSIVVLTPAAAAPLQILGQLPQDAGPLLLVVLGDATIGSSDGPATVCRGAVLVTGTLTVAGACEHQGHLFAGALTVRAPLRLVISSEWRSQLLPGLATPTIIAMTETAP